MVDIFQQMEALRSVFGKEQDGRNIYPYLRNLSCRVENVKDKNVVYPYNENRLDFLKEYFKVDIEKIYQKYTLKKFRRIEAKIQEGKHLFIRLYPYNAENIDDFKYVEIKSTDKTWYGSKYLSLENGKKIGELCLKIKARLLFHKFKDWVVYEDINISDARVNPKGNPENLYINRLYSSLLCISSDKYFFGQDIDKELFINIQFLSQRKEVYARLRGCSAYRKEYSFYINRCMDIYGKQRMTVEDFHKCLMIERKLLESMKNNSDN